MQIVYELVSYNVITFSTTMNLHPYCIKNTATPKYLRNAAHNDIIATHCDLV